MQTTLCPTDVTLAQLIQGQIGELEESPLAEHVEECDECQQKLSQLEADGSDSLLEQLRQTGTDQPFFQEPDCHWATSLAMGAISGNQSDDTHADDFDLPMDLGDYRILESIGHGGMGVVYRAHHMRLGRDVAVKIISGKRLTDNRATQRFEAEMRALGQLSHPNIVSALDARELSGQPVLIMEFVDGLDLSQVVARMGPLTPNVVAFVGRSVSAALEYASRNGMVHRDVKPSNIMINQAGEVKLLDLGLARFQLAQGSESEATATGLALGTADYMSPEQIHDARDADIRSDLYSLGCTLYKLLTGAAPYDDAKHTTNFAKLSAHVSSRPIIVPARYKQQSPELAELIERLVSKDRDDRPVNAQEVALVLEPLSEQADLPQLVQIARTVGPLESTNAMQSQAADDDVTGSWPPRWLLVTLAAGGVPLGLLLGFLLTIKQHDGTVNQVSVPDNAATTVDANGNVGVVLAGKTSEKTAGKTAGDPRGKSSETALQPISILDAAANETQQKASDQSSIQRSFGQTGFSADNAVSNGDASVNAAMQAVAGATQPIYRGYPFDAWMNLFEKDRNVDIAISAATALMNLADTPEQKIAVAKSVLNRCRKWGGEVIDDGGRSASTKWMNMLTNQYPTLMPDGGLQHLVEEIEQGNRKSRVACEVLLSFHFDNWFPSDSQQVGVIPIRPVLKQLVHVLIEQQGAKPEQSPGIHDYDSTADLAAGIALNARIPLAELPQPLSSMAKRQWERIVSMPTDSISRHIDFNPYQQSLQKIGWYPYWQTLPIDQRSPLHVLHQIFVDHSHKSKLLNAAEMFESLPAPKADDWIAIQKFLVQRLADSDFDERDAGVKLWPLIANWLTEVELLSSQDASELFSIIMETEDAIIKIVGADVYSSTAARGVANAQIRGGGGMGGGTMYGGGGFGGGGGTVTGGRETSLSADKLKQIEEVLASGCREMAELLNLNDDGGRQYRIPGGVSKAQKATVPVGGGGMF